MAGVVVLATIAGLLSYLVLKDKKCEGPECTVTAPTTSAVPPTTATVVPTTGAPVTTGTTSAGLADHMPSDLNVATDCNTSNIPALANVSGLVEQYSCTERSNSTISGATVIGSLFDSKASLKEGLEALNKAVSFSNSNAGKGCPPPAGENDGVNTWHRSGTPDKTSGVVECYTSTNKTHVYIWSDEDNYTLFSAETSDKVSFSTLEDWWENYA
ncbi:hypothetical protein ACFQX7_11195 [Luedemannella flava]